MKTFQQYLSGALVGGFASFLAVSAQAASVTVNTGQVFGLNGSYYSVTATGAMAYSSAKIGNDNLGGIVNTAIAPVAYDSLKGISSSPVGSFTMDSATGVIQSSTSPGGMYQVAKKNGLMTGGNLSVTNMTYNAASKTLYADVHGVSLVSGDLGSVQQMAFFTVDSATGFSAITGPGSFTSKLSGLRLTSTSLDYITRSLGLGGLAASVTKGTDFGVMTTTWNVSKAAVPAVPEPQTWALMGLGLVAVGGVRRAAQSRA